MPVRETLWLVSYDISDPRRLRRVAKYMERHGMRIQYSVFAVLANRRHIAEIRQDLEELIDARADDVRVYPIARNGPSVLLGAQIVAPDMFPMHEAFEPLKKHQDIR